MNILNTIKTYW